MEQFQIAPAGIKIFIWLFALAVALPCVITGVALFSRPVFDWRVFTFAVIFIFFVFLALAAPMFARHSIDIDDQNIRIKMAFYSESISRDELKPGSARIVLLSKTPDLQLRSRINGVGLPSYQVGWFSLNDGTKAFAAITSDEVIYIQSSKGYSLLVSVENANRFITKIMK